MLYRCSKSETNLNDLFFTFDSVVDPSSMADVQKESFVMAASCSRKQQREQPKTSGGSQEKEAQVTQSNQKDLQQPVHTSSQFGIQYQNVSNRQIINITYCLFYNWIVASFFPHIHFQLLLLKLCISMHKLTFIRRQTCLRHEAFKI